MENYWSISDAALALGTALKRIGELEQQKSRYDYSYPQQLTDDIDREARRARDAVRYLVSTEADD